MQIRAFSEARRATFPHGQPEPPWKTQRQHFAGFEVHAGIRRVSSLQ